MNNFVHAITSSPDVAVIAEYKRASPSLGDINVTVTVEEAVQTYQTKGAKALSILTNQPKFKGELDFISRAKTVTNLPILRKDFITDPVQVYESKQAGANAILLIVSLLSPEKLSTLNCLALELSLETLVEVHTLTELEQAITCKPTMVGINSRDLNTLQIDTSIFTSFTPHVPDEVVLVAESGLTLSDLPKLQELGFDAALIGTSLMRSL